MRSLQQITLPAPLGAPAALNRLLSVCATPYILLLESGAAVTAGWLSLLLEPLDDASVGLSGPSTNLCWNEQQVLPANRGPGWSVAQIDVYAASIASRYAGQRRPLDTLHSLNDFCYLFKSDLAESLGGFDETYGAGPCWEIDFNTRAARAGFKGIWVADAYVHRARATAAQVQTLRRLFTTNKHLYQDRFCGLRLRGEKTSYEEHCRGEACEHFAPPALIQVRLQQRPTLAEAAPPAQGRHADSRIECGREHIPASAPVSTSDVRVSLPDELPLVSCIMPTRNRRAFVRQALTYFARQDYPNRELIIVDDGDDCVADLFSPGDPSIRYIPLSRQTPIGAKRNIAVEQARGLIIAHWDDDDWYAPQRLRYQVTPLLKDKADITGLETSCFFDLAHWQAWTCTPELHRRLFVGDVHGGTLAYWRRLWEHLVRYPLVSLAEDATFLQHVCRRGARLHKLPHANSFVYVRHDSNAWRFPLGSYLQSAGWQRADVNTFLPAADLPFYAACSQAAPVLSSCSTSSASEYVEQPLVSCIMPTCNRRAFVQHAIEYFLRQDYANKELVIIDDGSDAIGDLVPADERIRYHHVANRLTVGSKRNLACEQARGDIIAHWDDDDWHASRRLRYQVEALLRDGTDICGITTPLFYNIEDGSAWQYVYTNSHKAWLSGSTLCYRRTFWASNRFANINVAEDARFVWGSRKERLTVLADATFHVGFIHRHNVSPKKTWGSYWHSYPSTQIQKLLGTDWQCYVK